MANQEKAKLLEHAQRVCMAVLGSNTPIQLDIQVFDAQDDLLPLPISPTHQFMIFIDATEVFDRLPTFREKLASFLGKDVAVQEVNKATWLYWGEGEMLSSATIGDREQETQSSSVQSNSNASIEDVAWLKTDTILPNWLDRLLFESLDARHEPDWKRFEHNLDLDEDSLRIYLGTYFPRSYAEAFCILDALFDTEVYSVHWQSRTEAHLLDIGCGTGGNLVGALTALTKHFPQLETIYVEGIDGNTAALEITRRILSSFAQQTQTNINVTLTHQLITNLAHLPAPGHGTYDFITSFKLGGEIISSGRGTNENIYHDLLTAYIDRLSDIGVFVLLDVTTKPEHTDFRPQLLNHQLSAFTSDHADYRTIFPIPCHFHEQTCSERCFTQKEFSVSHRAKRKDLSRVTYRVIGLKALAEALHHDTDRGVEYVIRSRSGNRILATCAYSSGRGKHMDGFSGKHMDGFRNST
ncbi:hypothetical protein ACFL3I_08270 [Pseudomonadota bacterium]